MPNNMKEEIFEALLKEAVIQNSLNELNSYPSEEELVHISISEECDKKVRKTIRKFRYTHRTSNILKHMQRVASFLLLILGISSMVLLSFKEVRAACYDVIIRIYDKYIQYEFHSQADITNKELSYIPDGYHLVGNTITASGLFIECENSEGEYIHFSYSTGGVVHVDNEHYLISDIVINGAKGQFFAAEDELFPNFAIWYDDAGSYRLTATALNKNEMIKIAENIQ